MKLIIAEKPSVGKSIASVVGATQKKDGYLQGNGYMVSWCIGHLVELASADVYHEKYAKWRREDLPIVPQNWQYQIPKDKKKQLDLLKRLMADPQVDSLICATDAGREGELIFRLVYESCACTKSVQRLWISSMEDEAIRHGMENLKDGKDFETLYQSALCRAQADWLVGINATRLFSVLYGNTLNVGRVMTPTLAILVNREAEIQAFQSEPFYTPFILCGGFTAEGERQKERQAAENIRSACNGNPATVSSVEKKQGSTPCPRLYDLTTLQRDANRLLGYTAQQTLDYLQILYEKRLTSYPRTDSQYLTQDMAATAKTILHALTGVIGHIQGISYTPDIGRIINSAKVSDHHGIIPTLESIKVNLDDLPAPERAVWQLVANRMLCAAGERQEFESSSVTLECAGHLFHAKGKTILHEGWKAIDDAFLATLKEKPRNEDDAPALPPMNEGAVFASIQAGVKEGKTTAPKRYTEDTLLSAMESAGSSDVPDNAERKGLGTPATRAGVIEKLVKTGFVERKKKNMVPSEKGINLIAILPDIVKSPALTAEWESMLKQIERGALPPDQFMGGIRGLLERLVHSSECSEAHKYLFPASDKREAIGVCPRCGRAVREGKKGFFCEDRDCAFALWKDNRFFSSKKKTLTTKVAAMLLKEGQIAMTGLYSEKTGKLYDGIILLDDTGGKYVNFKIGFQNAKGDKK